MGQNNGQPNQNFGQIMIDWFIQFNGSPFVRCISLDRIEKVIQSSFLLYYEEIVKKTLYIMTFLLAISSYRVTKELLKPDSPIAPHGATRSRHNGALTLSGAPFQGTWAQSTVEDTSPHYNSVEMAKEVGGRRQLGNCMHQGTLVL